MRSQDLLVGLLFYFIQQKLRFLLEEVSEGGLLTHGREELCDNSCCQIFYIRALSMDKL